MTEAAGWRILITGFGPFPGVADNVSAALAKRLAEAARARWAGHNITSAVLPTEWVAGPARLQQLWDEARPDLALHFGVASDARGLQIEAIGRNACRFDADAAGLLPVSTQWQAGGPPTCSTQLPLAHIVEALAHEKVPCCISEDAGAYLCNAVLYSSIQRAGAAEPPALAGFVHIPTELGDGDGNVGAGGTARVLTWPGALAGGLAIIACSLDVLNKRRETNRNGRSASRQKAPSRRG